MYVTKNELLYRITLLEDKFNDVYHELSELNIKVINAEYISKNKNLFNIGDKISDFIICDIFVGAIRRENKERNHYFTQTSLYYKVKDTRTEQIIEISEDKLIEIKNKENGTSKNKK